jgi:hypothetical protein
MDAAEAVEAVAGIPRQALAGRVRQISRASRVLRSGKDFKMRQLQPRRTVSRPWPMQPTQQRTAWPMQATPTKRFW